MASRISVRVPAQLIGEDAEHVYAALLGTAVTGGEGDGGIDVLTPASWGFPGMQVKSSIAGMIDFLKQAMVWSKRLGARYRWIPIAVGDPPRSATELRESFERYGAWVGQEFPNRLLLLRGISLLREMLLSPVNRPVEAFPLEALLAA